MFRTFLILIFTRYFHSEIFLASKMKFINIYVVIKISLVFRPYQIPNRLLLRNKKALELFEKIFFFDPRNTHYDLK